MYAGERMNIKKTDSKGRINLGVPGQHYYVIRYENGSFKLNPVPAIHVALETEGIE